jgi:hypothetical protein
MLGQVSARLAVAVGVVAILAAGGLAGCGGDATGLQPDGVDGSAWYPHYENDAALVSGVDLIVVGNVVASETRDINIALEGEPLVLPFLVSQVEVQRVIKGSVSEGQVIEVKQLLNIAEQPESQLLKEKDTRALLFLKAFPHLPYEPANPYQGLIRIERGEIKPADTNTLFKAGMAESEIVSALEGLAKR